MTKKFDFETLHPNHKFAFLDGALTAVAVVWIVNMFRNHSKKN